MKTDRRSRKTIGAIQNTTLQLLCTRRLGEIKIVDLCMAADINRTTFYLHFRNIREVLASLRNEIADRINADKRAAAFPKMGGTLEFLTSCAAVIGNFEYFEEFVRKSADADVFLTSLKNVLADRLYAHFCELYANVQLEAKCIIRFLTGGVLDIYAEWLRTDKTVSLETLLNLCAPMVRAGQDLLEKMAGDPTETPQP